MKALVIAGGYGTRLRPLTNSVNKSLIEFCNKPILEYQLRAAIEAGIDHIILALCDTFESSLEAIDRLQKKYKVKIDCSFESKPLGTAGPIKYAEHLICDPDDTSDSILLFNADIVCEYPIHDLIAAHIANDADITVLCTRVENPSPFGVIIHDDDMKVNKFVEKPTEFIGNLINAGLYVMNKRVIADIPLEYTSLERYLLPKIVERGKMYCFVFKGLWVDIGTPRDYLKAQELYINKLAKSVDVSKIVHSTSFGDLLATSNGVTMLKSDVYNKMCEDSPRIEYEVIPPILIHPSADIGKGSKIGPNVCIGKNVFVGEGCRIINSTIMNDVNIGNYCFVEGTIVGWSSKLNDWSHIEGLSVFGEGVEIEESTAVCGSFIYPRKVVSSSMH